MSQITPNELEKMQEKVITIKVMLENFDPNNQDEIDFIKSIVTDLNNDFSKTISEI